MPCVFDPSPQTSVDKGRSCPPWQSVAERARLVNDMLLNDIVSFRKAPSWTAHGEGIGSCSCFSKCSAVPCHQEPVNTHDFFHLFFSTNPSVIVQPPRHPSFTRTTSPTCHSFFDRPVFFSLPELEQRLIYQYRLLRCCPVRFLRPSALHAPFLIVRQTPAASCHRLRGRFRSVRLVSACRCQHETVPSTSISSVLSER